MGFVAMLADGTASRMRCASCNLTVDNSNEIDTFRPMKPIFTIHAGEYLVAATIEKKFRNYNIWLPSKDSGIDLLLTNKNSTQIASLQVKFSKDFSTTHTKEIFRPNIKGVGWWTLNRDKIKKSQADFWIFILYSLERKNHDFVIIKPKELLHIFDNTNRTANLIHCYITVTNHNTVFETRGLNDSDMKLICENKFVDNFRDLKRHLNNWAPIIQKLK